MREHLTHCECEEPGWCERHRCEKTRDLFEMCRRLEPWFQLWEQGQGPGQPRSPTPNPAPPKPITLEPCQHRGEEIRTEECATCSGHIRIKVFACWVHQECSLSPRLTEVPNCLTCNEYEAIETQQNGVSKQTGECGST